MRINEQVALIITQTEQKNKHNESEPDFEQWITTPTKQNSGDEYYWQHQDQLEKSSLHFDPQLHPQKIEEQIYTTLNSFPNENPISSGPIINIPTLQNYFSYQPEKISNNLLIEEPLTQSIMQKTQTQPQIMTSDVSADIRLTAEKAKQLEKTKDSALQYTNNQFKNHHLFIQNEQVELTLNTKDFTSEEQKNLMLIMKDHLKNNGLNLRKLIINGIEK